MATLSYFAEEDPDPLTSIDPTFADMTLCGINCASPLPKASAIHGLLQRLWSERTRWFEEWNGKREHVVEQGKWWRFTQPKKGDLRKMMLETGDRMLVEVGIVGGGHHGGRRLT